MSDTATPAADAVVTQEPRVITLWSTKNGKKVKVTSAATTWAELKEDIKAYNKNRKAGEAEFTIDGLLATENQRRTDLANDAAILPATAFVIYFRAKETKSGIDGTEGMGYKDLRAGIKEQITAHGEHAEAHFNEGKNYTNKSTDELRSLLASYTAPGAEKAPKGKAKTAAPANVADVVAEVAKAKTGADVIACMKADLAFIVENTTDDEVKDRAEIVLEEIDGLEAALDAAGELGALGTAPAQTEAAEEEVAEETESEEDRIAREAKEEEERLEKEEDERLEREAKELQSGYKK